MATQDVPARAHAARSSSWRHRLYRPASPSGHLEAAARPRPPGRHPDHPHRQDRRRGDAGPSSTRPPTSSRSRVNGAGVSEAEVTPRATSIIVVEIPGKSQTRPRETVERKRSCGSGWSPRAASARPRRPRPRARPAAAPPSPRRRVSPSGGGRSRARPTPRPRRPAADQEAGKPSCTDNRPCRRARRTTPTAALGRRPRPPTTPPDDGPTTSPTATPTPPTAAAAGADATATIDDPLTWMDNPDAKTLAAYQAFACDQAPTLDVDPRPAPARATTRTSRCWPATTRAASTCSSPRWSRAPTSRRVAPASRSPASSYAVNLNFNGDGTKCSPRSSRALSASTAEAVRDRARRQGVVRPDHERHITDGQAQITGNFTQESAHEPRQLAASTARCR